jgi:hypothetical protein
MYFEKFLSDSGFSLKVDGNTDNNISLSKEIIKEQKEGINQNREIELIQYLDDDGKPNQYIDDKLELLNIQKLPKDEVLLYKDIILDEFKMRDYLTFCKYVKTKSYIDVQVSKLKDTSYAHKYINTSEYKVKLIKEIEAIFKINPFDLSLSHLTSDNFDSKLLTDDLHKLVCSAFRSTKKKPVDSSSFKIYYLALLRNLFNNLDVIDSDRKRNKDGKRIMIYSVSHEKIERLFELYKHGDTKFDNVDQFCKDKFNLRPKVKIIKNLFC